MMELYHLIKKTVEEEGIMTQDPPPRTYLGPVTHRLPHLHIRTYSASDLRWIKQDSDIISDNIGTIFLPKDFDDIQEHLEEYPLTKKGIKGDSKKNIAFLQAEVQNWLGMEGGLSKDQYIEMWDNIPNTDLYSDTASDRIADLIDKLDSLLRPTLSSKTRSFDLRFPGEYCPVVWSFVLSSDLSSLEASLIFRSIEVSRNIINDFYLFCVYFGYIFSQYKERKLYDINITAINFFAQDAHIIDFGE